MIDRKSMLFKLPTRKRKSYKHSFINFGRKMIPEWAKSVINNNEHLKEAYGKLRRVVIKPKRSPRVFIKKGIQRMQFFDILHERKVDYVLLRWWQDLPKMPPGEDMDILVKDEHRDLLNDLVVFYDNGTGLKCDIYTITGSNDGSWKNLPYFQSNLAHTLIDERILFKGAYVPSPQIHFASLAYHAIYHKGGDSGIPGFSTVPLNLEHNYAEILEQLAREIGLNLEINLKGLVAWLKEQGFTPAEDTMAKLVELKPELALLQKPLYSDIRGGDLLVYIIREQLVEDGYLNPFIDFLKEKFCLDILDVKMLCNAEKDICKRQIRGGKWDKGPYPSSGGEPVAFIIAYDYNPWPLEGEEAKKQSRMTNRNNPNAKYKFREFINTSINSKKKYNGIHSADNELDAWFYITQLGEIYRKKIHYEVELRRERYATRWSVKKIIATGPASKVEIINYNKGLAVKKTFKPGREQEFERELLAAGELSKDFEFLPTLLEEGSGFIIYPFYQNILDELESEEKRNHLYSKKTEIEEAIGRLGAKGYKHSNLCLENLILTGDGQFYFTSLSSIQTLTNIEKLPDSYNIAIDTNDTLNIFKL